MASAIAADDGLVDYKFSSSADDTYIEVAVEDDKGAAKDKKKKWKKKWGDEDTSKEGHQPRKGTKGCYLFGSTHFMRECP